MREREKHKMSMMWIILWETTMGKNTDRVCLKVLLPSLFRLTRFLSDLHDFLIHNNKKIWNLSLT